ncbi:hypothetical protein C451_14080 [Halococcus thailandensis JCM 13552]|uniref:Uncharacterized protein n=1 Tax=Halococcus thailandensis JCM 13552 TaxID=1227457 RepID=M0N2E5_9EURY|nr:hypothetical protein C451_14080 [Halococcus thailandensis JCM 13552]
MEPSIHEFRLTRETVAPADPDESLSDNEWMQPTDTCSGGRGTCEIRVDEAETLSRFYEACDEHGIVCSIERLYHQ